MQLFGRLIKKYTIILAFILLLGGILRLWGLNKYPTGFTPDEASFGYDAYSLLKTGKDQWGNFWPLVLKSFGDYKAPVYAYLTMPSVFLFGLNKFAVRLPNALLGIASIYILYLLSLQIFNKLEIDNSFKIKNLRFKISDLIAVLLAISPWHIMMSRGAFEANLITFFVPLGIYLFLKEKYNLSAIIFGLSMFTYHSAKVIAPLIFIMLFIVFKKKIVKPIMIFALFLLITFYTFLLGAGARVNDINIFSGSLEAGSELKNAALQAGEPYVVAKIFNNKFTVSFARFFDNYFSYFSPQFLLTKGPAETTYGMMPGTGVLNIIEFAGFLVGLFYLFSSKLDNKYKILIIFWLLVSPIPASLTTGPGYAGNRAVAMIPSVQIISGLGIYYLLANKRVLGYLILALGFLSFCVFAERYVFLSPQKSAGGMLAGNLEASVWLSKNAGGKKIIVSRKISEPQIYIAFANKWDPVDYQNTARNWKLITWVDQISEYSLGNYDFKNIDFSNDSKLPETLIVGKSEEFPENVKDMPGFVTSFGYQNSRPAIVVYSTYQK